MVYPGIPVDPSPRSIENPSIYQPSSSNQSVILPQQQLVYTSYNAYYGVPQSSFDTRRYTQVASGSHFNLRTQDYRTLKTAKWHQKTRPRYKEYPQMSAQQPMTYPQPVVVYDPSHMTPSVYVNQTPTCYTDSYSYSPNVLPQSYYKPPEAQPYCLIHDRNNSQYHQATNYQKPRVYSNHLTSHGNSNYLSYSADKTVPFVANASKNEIFYPEKTSSVLETRGNINDNVFEITEEIAKPITPPLTPQKPPKIDKYFDDSANFDFTIEAEKMVSALCNTSSSHELENDKESVLKSEDMKPWYLDDFPPAKTSKTVETQTFHSEDLHCPDNLRKSIYNGCTEMETLLKASTPTYRQNWLLSLSAATKIALSKSSTCFPIYLNDKAFSQDLMNSFLRISNGWLALDNYLNKQPNLSLSQKFDKELQKSFKAWEAATATLLDNITKNFKKLDSGAEEPLQENPSSSFPGDVSLYVNYNLLSTTAGTPQKSRPIHPTSTVMQDKRWLSFARESKLRTKWTITDNTRSLRESEETTANIWSPSAPTYSSLLYPDRHTPVGSLLTPQDPKKPEETPESETINLSAWLASMRFDTATRTDSSTWPKPPSTEPKPTVDIMGTSKMDANRQLRTLKNMRMIQTAPWTANQLLEDPNAAKKNVVETMEDRRIYMKPGSYNVPKKKYHSKRASRKTDATSTTRKACPQAEQVPRPPASFFDSENILDGTKSTSSSSSISSGGDDRWKAACASAELLLDALNVKKKKKENDNDEDPMSSDESSEDNTERSSVTTRERTNIKTDTWLIRTLNNAAKINETDSDKIWKKNETEPVEKVPNESSKTDSNFPVESTETMTLVDAVGKATYSETVRRFSKPPASTVTTVKSDGCATAAALKQMAPGDAQDGGGEKLEEGRPAGEKKQKKGKGADKGWSVWYSSRRKNQQGSGIGTEALEKLMGIYKTLWRMDATRVFKFPAGTSKDSEDNTNLTIENYRKVIKSPMFLETIGYKLKNHVYRKIDHAVRDFRKIVHNSKIYHRNDKESTEKIEVLSKKLEELLDQHFLNDSSIKATQNTSNPPAGNNSPRIDDKELKIQRRNTRNS